MPKENERSIFRMPWYEEPDGPRAGAWSLTLNGAPNNAFDYRVELVEPDQIRIIAPKTGERVAMPSHNAVVGMDLAAPGEDQTTFKIPYEIPKLAKPAESALDVQVGGGHYKDLKIQPVEFIHANNIPFIEGCVIKYVSRWRSKGGVADLQKARHFIDMLIELEERE